ncbi:hypothetical protein ABTA62_19605, partial [Acinetobacter baumannii]
RFGRRSPNGMAESRPQGHHKADTRTQPYPVAQRDGSGAKLGQRQGRVASGWKPDDQEPERLARGVCPKLSRPNCPERP